MFNLQRLLEHLRPKERIAANYVLYQDRLFTKKPVSVKHDRIRFIRKSFKKDPEINLIDLQGESFYLLLIHVDNIAHFFHDVFFRSTTHGALIKNGFASRLMVINFNESF